MKVDKVNFNIVSGRTNRENYKKNYNNKPYFSGNIPQAVIETEINNLNPPILKWVNKLRSNIGEFQDICINALGTGLLAPIFIKYNPLSKTDEDTRTYSAWRQPISAALAVLTQGLVTIPVVNIINSMANNGWFDESCNMTPFKDDKYIYKMMKKLNPEVNKQQIINLAESYKTQQAEGILNSLRKDNTVYYHFYNSGKSEPMNPDRYNELLNKTVDLMINDEKKELERCKTIKHEKMVARNEFFRTNSDSAQALLNEMKDKINSTDNISDINSYMKNKYKKLKSEKANPQLLEIVEETHTRINAGKDEMLLKINKMLSHLDDAKKCSSKEEIIKLVENIISKRISEHNEALNFLNEVKEAIKNKKTVSQIEEMFKNKHRALKNAKKEFRLDDKIFAQEVVKTLKNQTKKHIEGVKRISTLITALAMLPISCSLLNWVYPRFMDAVFPKLSSKKHSNEAKVLVDEATKNSEVK